MSTIHRHRSSVLRNISKNVLGNADSEGEYSASPSPSAWVAQMQRASQEYTESNKHNNNTDMNNSGFAFQAINQRKEIISDHSDSEMVSEYVDTEVSEEEIIETQIPFEVEVEESESGYTSVTSIANSPLQSVHRSRNRNRRHSVPILKHKNTNNEIRSPNAENRPPLHTPNHSKNGRLSTVSEESKDKETESVKDIGIPSLDKTDQSKGKSKKKRQTLSPTQLSFDSPAPPSILLKQKNAKNSTNQGKALRNKKTPHFSDIGKGLSQIPVLQSTDNEPSPLVSKNNSRHSSVRTKNKSANKSLKSSEKSSLRRKQMTKTVTGCTKGIEDGLDDVVAKLKETFPSPAPVTVQTQTQTQTQTDNSDNDSDMNNENNKPIITKRRRSSRLAKKHKAENEYKNVTERRGKKNTNKTKQSSQSGNEEMPYIDDNQINDDPPLPNKSKQKSPKNKNSDKQEQDDDEGNGNQRLISVARSNQRKSRYSNVSNRSLISQISQISSAHTSQSQSVSEKRRRTLRSRKTQPMTDNNMSADECGTFDTPKSNTRMLRGIRSKSNKPRPKGKMTKSPKSPKSKNRKISTQSEGEYGSDDMNDMMDIDSPNLNENCDEKMDIENERSDDEIHTKGNSDSDNDNGSVGNEIITRSKSKTRKKKKKRNSGKEEASTKKRKSKKKKKTVKKKSKKSRKRKASDSDSDTTESYAPNPKRPRLSQYMKRPNEEELEKVTGDGLRRSKRVKFKPLAFWANQRVEYTPNVLTYDTVGTKAENGETVIAGQSDVLGTWQSKVKKSKKPSRRSKKKKSKKSKKKKKKKTKQKSTEPMIFDGNESDSENECEFDGNAWIYDSINDEMIEKCVVKTKKCVKLVPLTFGREKEGESSDSNSNSHNTKAKKEGSVKQSVRGAKGLEELGFSCGILEIPPMSKKEAEMSFFTEQFFVHHCEKKKLVFKVGDSDGFALSEGAMFFVPPENEYEIVNLSKTHPVQLVFTLIKKEENQNENEETQTQMSDSQMISAT